MGFDERHVLPSLRLLPYDRLVLVAGRDTVRLPVLQGVSLDAAFSSAERAIARVLHGPITHDRLVSAVASQGFARRTVLGALQSLAGKGLVELGRDAGPVWVRPSPRFALFRDHLRQVPKKG